MVICSAFIWAAVFNWIEVDRWIVTTASIINLCLVAGSFFRFKLDAFQERKKVQKEMGLQIYEELKAKKMQNIEKRE